MRRLLTGTRSSHSSIDSLADASEISVNLLIQQLKANIFEFDLLNAIKGDVHLGTNIQKLLVELNKQKVPDSMVQFLFEFKAYFEYKP